MDFIAFDIETTGTVAGVDRVVEIGFVKFEKGEAVSTYSTLVDPGIPIPPDATRVNGITNDMVKGKPILDKLLPGLTEFCGDLPLVAHNAAFDFGFLQAEYLRAEEPAPRGAILDTLLLAKKLLPGLPNYRLSSLVAHFELGSGEFHRAQDDATFCGYVFLNLLTKMNKQVELISLSQLEAIMGKPVLRFPLIEKRPKQMDLFALI
ncbi:MAG: 3'-5' exonuclease [Bdellovibrionaceae bacterium]|jgi:DNA polymerase-3 subunit epsilon|nr:3'-5' exonuclease [Pseudobdellovibrionaceae bacterium]